MHMGSICDDVSYCQVKKLMILAISGERPVLKKDKDKARFDSASGPNGSTSGADGTTSGSGSKNVSTYHNFYKYIY